MHFSCRKVKNRDREKCLYPYSTLNGYILFHCLIYHLCDSALKGWLFLPLLLAFVKNVIINILPKSKKRHQSYFLDSKLFRKQDPSPILGARSICLHEVLMPCMNKRFHSFVSHHYTFYFLFLSYCSSQDFQYACEEEC